MKLSDYAKKAGISYRTAWRWWKQGNLTGYRQISLNIITPRSHLISIERKLSKNS